VGRDGARAWEPLTGSQGRGTTAWGEMAPQGGQQGGQRWAAPCRPLGCRAGCQGALPAIVGHWGLGVPPARRQDTGPWPPPRWLPLPGRLEAQVLTQSRRKRLAGGKHPQHRGF